MSELTDRRTCWQSVTDKVAQLNRKLRGWANYFSLGTVGQVYDTVMTHTYRRARLVTDVLLFRFCPWPDRAGCPGLSTPCRRANPGAARNR